MSADTLPITPARFAEALKDLPVSSLHLKVLELRNNIAHLDYSNEQLRPFAEGRAVALSSSTSQDTTPQPDPDCIEAIRENEEVIARIQERIRLVRAEVESRGLSWTEFQSKEEVEDDDGTKEQGTLTNGVNGVSSEGEGGSTTTRHSAWTDGTFQTGVIRNGEVHMDSNNVAAVDASASEGQSVAASAAAGGGGGGGGGGGSLSDEELRRRMEQMLQQTGDDEEEGGLHL